MGPHIDLKSSFISNLEMRGISVDGRDVYPRLLTEVAAFLVGRPPRTWTRYDFEAFLKQRASDLPPADVAAYGIGLGVLTEIIEKSLERNTELNLDEELQLATSSQLPNLDCSDTLLPGEMYKTSDTSELPAQDFREDDDFLSESIEEWKRSTGRTGRTSTPGDSPESASRDTRPNLAPIGTRKGMTPDVRVLWSAEEQHVYLTWRGFVEGHSLRTAFASGLALMHRNRGVHWVVDMRTASVLSLADSAWLSDWLLDAGRRGVRKFAIVQPEHTISRMQMKRLREATYASTAGLPSSQKVQLAFFDDVEEAARYLTREY